MKVSCLGRGMGSEQCHGLLPIHLRGFAEGLHIATIMYFPAPTSPGKSFENHLLKKISTDDKIMSTKSGKKMTNNYVLKLQIKWNMVKLFHPEGTNK